MVDLSIVIYSNNNKENLQRCLQMIYASKGNFSFDVFVFDNSSEDGSVEMVQLDYPKATLIASKEKVGYAKANNQVITEIMRINSGKISKYVLLLNPDIEPKSNTLINILKWMEEHPSVGVAGCHIMDTKGETIPTVRKFPTLKDQLALLLDLRKIFPKILDEYRQANFDYTRAKQVSSIRGGFFLMNTRAFKNRPMLDESYSFWFEKVDFCRHLYKYNDGAEVWYTPVGECIDHVGQSFEQLLQDAPKKKYRDSQLNYFKKWKPYWQYLVLKMIWPISLYFAAKSGIMTKTKDE